MNKLDPQKSEE